MYWLFQSGESSLEDLLVPEEVAEENRTKKEVRKNEQSKFWSKTLGVSYARINCWYLLLMIMWLWERLLVRLFLME